MAIQIQFFRVTDVLAIGQLIPREFISVAESTVWRRSNDTKEFRPESHV